MTLGIHGQFEFGTGNSYQQLCPRQSQAQADRNNIQMKHLENNDPYMRGQPPPYSVILPSLSSMSNMVPSLTNM
ncbi:unnamed protein product, partial [Rotaria magnacalcarata]